MAETSTAATAMLEWRCLFGSGATVSADDTGRGSGFTGKINWV